MAGEIIQYQTEDGATVIRLQAQDGDVWLSQADMAELFQATKQNISLHIRNILDEGELGVAATVKENLTVQTEGKRQVSRQISYYSLPMIMAVAPSAVEQHFAEAVGKVKAIEGARPKPVKGRER